MPVQIWGRYTLTNEVEKIDEAETKQEATRLAGEYRMAFGRDWVIWLKTVKPEQKGDEVRRVV